MGLFLFRCSDRRSLFHSNNLFWPTVIRLIDHFSGQNPHCISPGTSFEKQHVVRTVVFSSSDGSHPFKYVANKERGAMSFHVSSFFNMFKSARASSLVPGFASMTWYCHNKNPKMFSHNVKGETDATVRIWRMTLFACKRIFRMTSVCSFSSTDFQSSFATNVLTVLFPYSSIAPKRKLFFRLHPKFHHKSPNYKTAY